MVVSTAAGEVTLRLVTDDDEQFVRELFEASKPQLQQLPLPEPQRRQLVDLQWHAQRTGYAAAYPDAEELIIEVAGRAVGRLILDRSGATVTVVDIAIAPAERNHGIGAAVLTDVLSRAETTRLRVAADSPARRLYERLGFRERGRTGIDLDMEFERPATAPASQESAMRTPSAPGFADFADRVGTDFALRLPDGGQADLVLTECAAAGPAGSFSLMFKASPRAPMEQASYQLSAEGFGPLPVFLVPVAQRPGDPAFPLEYQAIFTSAPSPA